MSKLSKIVLAFIMVAVLCFCSVACVSSKDSSSSSDASQSTDKSASPASQRKVSLSLATNWGEGDSKFAYFQPKFEEFANANADSMEIQLITYSTEDYKTKIRTQTASGDLPDAFTFWGGPLMKNMVDAGLLLDVDEYFKDSTTVKKDDFDPSSFGYYTAADGKVYGIPIESTRGVFLVNTEIFKKYNLQFPTTYDDLKNVSKVLNENGIIPIAMASNGGQPAEFFFSEIYVQFSGAEEELDKLPSSKKFNTQNALKVAQIIEDMIANNMFPEDTVANGGWGPCLQLYTDQKAAMTYTYPWMFEFIPENIQEISEIIPLPKMPGADIEPSTIMTGFTIYGFLINKASYTDPVKHDAVLKLCDFLASDDLSLSLTNSGMVPAKKIDYGMSKQKLIYQKMMKYAEGKKLVQVHYTKMPTQDSLNMLDTSLDELFIKALSPQEFVDKVQATLE